MKWLKFKHVIDRAIALLKTADHEPDVIFKTVTRLAEKAEKDGFSVTPLDWGEFTIRHVNRWYKSRLKNVEERRLQSEGDRAKHDA